MKFSIKICIALILSILLLGSCEGFLKSETEDCDYPDYSDCDTHEPEYADLKIEVLNDDSYKLDRVEVFLGNVEKGDIVKVISNLENNKDDVINVSVATDTKYSARAFYINSPDTFVCIDGTKIKKRKYTNCDSTCWYVTGDEIDLVLKI